MADIFALFKKIEKTPFQPAAPITHIICGLGNPGDEYTFTRHNAGFLTLDYFAQKLDIKINRAKFSALTAEGIIGGKRILFMKPQTFMNASGEAVRDAADFYKIPSENIIVINDDMDLEPGRMRIRLRGSDGGHRGLKSIIYQLGTDVFPRIKLGVGSPPTKDAVVNWVLGSIPKDAQESFFKCVENAYDAVPLMLSGQSERAMNLYNS
ncbi:MAG: aminoacyl-tRNA hydrolase [Eubacteriales bacterium]